jgi:hypothetical protein
MRAVFGLAEPARKIGCPSLGERATGGNNKFGRDREMDTSVGKPLYAKLIESKITPACPTKSQSHKNMSNYIFTYKIFAVFSLQNGSSWKY